MTLSSDKQGEETRKVVVLLLNTKTKNNKITKLKLYRTLLNTSYKITTLQQQYINLKINLQD